MIVLIVNLFKMKMVNDAFDLHVGFCSHIIMPTSLSYQFATLNTGLAESIAVSSSV